MKFVFVALVLLAADTAEAGLIRWSYVENTLSLTSGWNEPVPAPFEVPDTAGPLRFSFELDPADFPDLGRAPVVLPNVVHITVAEPWYSIRNMQVTGNAGTTLTETWNLFSSMGIEIGADGDIASWTVAMWPGGRNSSLFFSDEAPSLLSFYRTDFTTYAESIRYGGSGGTWNRTGGDEIFAAPVPLPASILLLAGGLAGLCLLRRHPA